MGSSSAVEELICASQDAVRCAYPLSTSTRPPAPYGANTRTRRAGRAAHNVSAIGWPSEPSIGVAKHRRPGQVTRSDYPRRIASTVSRSLRSAPSNQHGWASSRNARRAVASRFRSFFVVASAHWTNFGSRAAHIKRVARSRSCFSLSKREADTTSLRQPTWPQSLRAGSGCEPRTVRLRVPR